MNYPIEVARGCVREVIHVRKGTKEDLVVSTLRGSSSLQICSHKLDIIIKCLQSEKALRVKNRGEPPRSGRILKMYFLCRFPNIHNVVVFSMWAFCKQEHCVL